MATLTAESSTIEPLDHTIPVQKRKEHLPFLDGIRALMALWVMFGHAFQDFIHVVDHRAGNGNFLPQPFYQQAFYAHFAVDVFIVVSGFCLMLPIASRPGLRPSGGWSSYAVRRCRRILPPYYAALLLSLALSGLRWYLTRRTWEAKAIQQIDFSPSAIVAHLCLVQNLWDPWARAIDGPTWSVATEVQIYFAFPLLLLPLWRRVPTLLVVAFAFTLGVDIFIVTGAPYCATNSGLSACSWYLGLFAMGMYAADSFVSGKSNNNRDALLTLGLVCLTAAVTGIVVLHWMPVFMWLLDLIVGVGAASLIGFFASSSRHLDSPLSLRILEWKPLTAIGAFSYSLYLIHAPLLNVVVTLLMQHRADGFGGCIVISLSLVVVVFLASLFYRYVEQPSMAKNTP